MNTNTGFNFLNTCGLLLFFLFIHFLLINILLIEEVYADGVIERFIGIGDGKVALHFFETF